VIRAALIIAALAAALASASCGRRGSPELPAEAASMDLAPVDPTQPQGRQAPDRAFVLDPILQ
jgi:predicted small lipoprotein YifL